MTACLGGGRLRARAWAFKNSIGAAGEGGLKEQVQQSVNFLSLLSETIPLPKHRYQWASDRTELT